MDAVMDELDLTPEEREQLEESSAPNGGVTYRNQDFDVMGLVSRLNKGEIIIPRIGLGNADLELNEFQRGFVWKKKQMDSFIESLLLEYPVPNLFMVQQSDRRLVVLDGQQRLETLRQFYQGLYNDRKYRLKITNSRFDGLSYDELDGRDRRILDNTYITSTVISVSASPGAREAVYDVFARLNSGGTQLTPHEIRMAIYNGPLMQIVDEMNRRASWRVLYGSERPNKRFRDHELVLRILALHLYGDSYAKPLSGFLNNFCEANRNMDNDDIQLAVDLFNEASDFIAGSGVPKPFALEGGSQLNTAKADAVMVGVMDMLSKEIAISQEQIARVLKALNHDERFVAATTRSTSDESQVRERIALVKAAMRDA